MKYLDEDIEITVYNLTISTDGTYTYTILVGNDVVFIGNCFLQAGQTSVSIAVNDIISSYKYNPNKFARTNPDTAFNDVTNEAIPEVTVRIADSTGNYKYNSEYVAMIYRYPHRLRALETNVQPLEAVSDGFIMRQGNLIPRIPYALTNNYGLGFMLENGYIGKWTSKIQGDFLKTITLPTDQNYIYTKYYRGTDLFNNTSATPIDDVTINISSQVTATPVEYLEMEETYEGTAYVDTHIQHNEFVVSQSSLKRISVTASGGRNVCIVPVPTTTMQHASYRISGKDSPTLDWISFHWDGTSDWDVTILNYDTQFDARSIWLLEFDYVITNPRYDEVTISNIKLFDTTRGLQILPLAIAEACPAKYYLQWVDRYGSLQSQPFNGKDKFSEQIETQSIQNYLGHNRKINWEINPKWEINTQWIDANLYPYYESIFVSPYLVLYDTENDVAYDVVLTDKTYKEEQFKNDKKMFNLTLNIELDKKQNILN